MDRRHRLAILAGLTLLVAVAGTVAATRAPEGSAQPAPLADEGDEVSDPEAITHAIDRLADSEISVDEAVFDDLAARYGVGGAVRISAWASETGRTVDEIAAMRDGDGETPVGWGRLARELGVHPGIGSIMGNGRGAGDPPGQERNADD
jgi:hypothetical protein